MIPYKHAMGQINKDFNKANPTTPVDSNKIYRQHTIEMRGGDTLQLQMSIDSAQARVQVSPNITITFYNISKVIKTATKTKNPLNKKQFIERKLLDRVSGQAHAGQVVALMGPSGSGKTTLLNALAGRALTGVTGDIWFNNQRYNKAMKRKLAYVLQDDIFYEKLSVKQQLTYTALLRLPNHLSKQEKLNHVENLIKQLGIEQCADTPIMLISGGEKKRMNIATELLTNPSVIFLDEPTSGLDSTSALTLIEILRDLSMKGKTIITSIHQPSSQIFLSFDQIILLADGKTIYMGKPCDAVLYFREIGYRVPPHFNVADFAMDLVNRDLSIRERLKEAYQALRTIGNDTDTLDKENSKYPISAKQYLIGEPSGNESDLTNPENVSLIPSKEEGKWPIGFFQQTSILFSRAFFLTGGNQFTILNFVQAFTLAVVYGLCWLRMKFTENTIPDRSSFIFNVLILWPFEAMMTGILSFPNERGVLQKERASGLYRLSSYFVAKTLAELPLKLILPTIFLIICYWMANINPNFGIFLGVGAFQIMAILIADSLGLLLGAAFKNLDHAMTAATILLIALMLVGGFFVRNLPSWLNIWIKWLSFLKYAYDACLVLIFKGGQVYACSDGSYVPSCRNNPNGTFISTDALQYFDIGLSIEFNFLALLGYFIGFRIIAYLALRFLNTNQGRS